TPATPDVRYSPSPLSAPPDLRRLLLTVDYEDGFVAYLNGVEIARRGLGAPGTFVSHDAAATPHRTGTPEAIDVTKYLGLLRRGANVLALQGHKVSRASASFTLTARLHATGPIAITRYPYLQRPSPDTVIVAWKTAL